MNVHVQDRGGRTTGGRDSFSDLREDFGAPIRGGRPYSSVDARGRPRKELGTARPVPRSSVEWILPTTSGGRADRARELAPRPQPRETRRQMQDDPAHRALHPHGELDQSLPQRGDLASAPAVPRARRWSSWNRMYAASVSRTRNWLPRNREQLVRSISSP